jgi:hypothetical protein
MKHGSARPHRTTWGIIVRSAFVVALSGLLAAWLPQPGQAGPPAPPPLPENLTVPAGNKAFLVGYAVGTQNYVCLPSGSSLAWAPYGPQATLFDEHGKQITTHFLSPNPDEGGTARPTWQHSRDTSAVWAMPIASSLDPDYVAPGAIAWLLLEVMGREDAPGRGDKLSDATFIHRVNTAGGVAPTGACEVPGQKAFVPYTTAYIFYKAAPGRGH